MKTEKIRQLINKYEEGQTSLQEEQILRNYFRNEDVPEDLQEYTVLFHHSSDIQNIEAPQNFDPFEKIDFDEAEMFPFGGESSRPLSGRRGMAEIGSTTGFRWATRVAAGFALLIIGFAAGHFLGSGKTASNNPVNSRIEAMEASLVNTFSNSQPSASKRLEAVNISYKIPQHNKKLARQIAVILIHTMNNDDNVNVRLAAAEALFKYRDEVPVKPVLIHSLAKQNDPLMQISIIRMLVKLKANNAIPAMRQLLVSSETGKLVRRHLQGGIAKLQAKKSVL